MLTWYLENVNQAYENIKMCIKHVKRSIWEKNVKHVFEKKIKQAFEKHRYV